MTYKGGRHIAKWQWDQIYDPAITTSLIKYDEEGEIWITVARYLLKMGVHATINIGTQMVYIYATDDNVENWEQAWKKIDWGEVSLNAFTSIIPGKKERDLLEIGGNIALCLKNNKPQNLNDVIQCGFYSLIDFALGNISDIALDKAITKLKKVWPELSLKKADLGEQQDANAPPQISANTETKALPEAKQQLLLPEKISHLKHKILDYPNLNKELDKLGDLKEQFFKDFDELADDDILFLENNTNCVDAWKRLHDCKAPDDLRQNFGAVKALYMTKGDRPAPSTYLSKEYIDAHMKKFEDGAAFIITADDYINYPTIGHDAKFVSNPESIEKIVRDANGDLRKIENALGLKKNYLGNNKNEVYIIYIQPKQIKNARMPSGNESGANMFWIPGGCTASENAIGIPEIVIDCSHLPNTMFNYDEFKNLIPINLFH